MILDHFPSAEEFYKTYWNKKPFIVRGYIDPELIGALIDGDELAGLALEEDIKSRIITNDEGGGSWACEHGPFEEERFGDLGERNWSLLVQNVEQYHLESSALLEKFHFSPRWLLDDIMVSYSAPGGSVGPHIDSYHTFLVQGIGKRAWKLSDAVVENDECIEGAELKVLKHGFEGETFEVTAGDVIYVPPFFGHAGETIEAAMTFSVGFLGPKLSEMMGDYAQYLEQNDAINKRYFGAGLNAQSSAFAISPEVQNNIQDEMVASLQSDDFAVWMAQYFATPTHDDAHNIEGRADEIDGSVMMDALQGGEVLGRPEHIKLSITTSDNGAFHIAFLGEAVSVPAEYAPLVGALNGNGALSLETLGDDESALALVVYLYNRGVLIFASEGEDS